LLTGGDAVAATRAELSGLAALVTGCGRGRGIGRAVALSLAGAGADVAVTDISSGGVHNAGEPQAASADGLEALVDEINQLGRRAIALTGDVADAADVEAVVAAAVAGLGRVDVLVNNAAAPHGGDRAPSWRVPEQAYDAVMRVNAKGVFLMSGAVIRHLLGRSARGRIVNIASVAGKVGYPERAVYCASKFAVIGLTQAMAQELAPHGITVNAVCPGAVATDRNAATRYRAATTGDAAAGNATSSPVGRIGEPDDIARAVLYLADPAASYVTGQSLVVDGGRYMN
jgi:NAD(P)-dependent dehydrogenase (short-subunit alcohol dehydrogenase family)